MESIRKPRAPRKAQNTREGHFWKRVDKSGDCWIWTGKKVGNGYGCFSHGTRGAVKHYRAHRFSYEWAYGPIPPGLQVLHRCDNPPCVNPAHLFLGTDKDNAADKMAKGRGISGDRQWTRIYPERVLRGEQHSQARLTEEQVREIRRRYIPRKISCQQLASEYGVNWRTIHAVVSRQTWRHIE